MLEIWWFFFLYIPPFLRSVALTLGEEAMGLEALDSGWVATQEPGQRRLSRTGICDTGRVRDLQTVFGGFSEQIHDILLPHVKDLILVMM